MLPFTDVPSYPTGNLVSFEPYQETLNQDKIETFYPETFAHYKKFRVVMISSADLQFLAVILSPKFWKCLEID